MNFLKKYALLMKLLLGILVGVIFGLIGQEVIIRLLSTFNFVFGSLLNFTIPLIILAFITKGISDLSSNSRRLLGLTVALAYASTIIMGSMAYTVASNALPVLLTGQSVVGFEESTLNTTSYIVGLKILPLMDVMTALILSFILGIGLSGLQSSSLKSIFDDFHTIITGLVMKVIIPLLPLHIAGIFAKMTYTGQATVVMNAFIKVFILVIALHITALLIQYTIAGIISKKNPFLLLKNMLPAYITAVGTQSSAATIPVTAASIKNNKVKDQIAEFVASLCSTIHLSGSMITITTCSIAVMILFDFNFSAEKMIPFILLLGVMMIAAPGLPGGAIITAAGILQSSLGFTPEMGALMITLYIAQDSFGTACNVTGDGAIAVIVDAVVDKK